MEEKYNQLDDENASDTSEKSKTGLGTPEKKGLIETKKDPEPVATAPPPAPAKIETKEEEEQDSDHEDPHGKYYKKFIFKLQIKLYIFQFLHK